MSISGRKDVAWDVWPPEETLSGEFNWGERKVNRSKTEPTSSSGGRSAFCASSNWIGRKRDSTRLNLNLNRATPTKATDLQTPTQNIIYLFIFKSLSWSTSSSPFGHNKHHPSSDDDEDEDDTSNSYSNSTTTTSVNLIDQHLLRSDKCQVYHPRVNERYKIY